MQVFPRAHPQSAAPPAAHALGLDKTTVSAASERRGGGDSVGPLERNHEDP
jgi:hypothetical protein